MADMDIASTSVGTSTRVDFSVDSKTTDGPTEQKETTWINSKWTEYLGYYDSIPELAAVIDAKATWTIGKGFKADEATTLLLDTIKGNGKDTFNTILENMVRTYHIGGDAFAEIVRDDKGMLVNLKPLNPNIIKIVANRKGIIIRYEQVNKVSASWLKRTWGKITGKGSSYKFKPEEIFHLMRNRVADEIHGQSMVKKLIPIILMKNEAMADWKKVLHRNICPLIVWHLDEDDPTKVAQFKAAALAANKDDEMIFIPKGAVEREVGGVPPNATLSPITWIDSLDNKFYEAAHVPKIIVGGTGGFTDAAVKIAYLAFQQTTEEEQLFNEEQVLAQLNLVIELEFPVSLQAGALSEKPEAEERPIENEQAVEPNDMTAETEGKK